MKDAGFPEISTFGALMRYAITLEDYCGQMYERAASASALGEMKERLAELQAAHQKRKARLEEALRLKLNEVTIEPVSTLKREDYLVDVGDIASKPLDEAKALMAKVEAMSQGFYRDSAAYSEAIAREVMRIFERMARDNEKFGKKLR